MKNVGWYARRKGILEHLDSGKISLFDLAVHDVLCLTCDYTKGLAISSAAKIHALCPGSDYRAVKRSVEHLEEIGWIKRWPKKKGEKGNYPILIARFEVHDSALKSRFVNAERTKDYRHIQFDPGPDEHITRPDATPKTALKSALKGDGENDGSSGVSDNISERQRPDPGPDAVSDECHHAPLVKNLELKSESGHINRDEFEFAGRKNANSNRAAGTENRSAAAPSIAPSNGDDPQTPDMISKLSDRELKGLVNSLRASVRDRRLDRRYRDTTRQKLNRVLAEIRNRPGTHKGPV